MRSNVVAVALCGFAAAGCDLITGDKKSITISAEPLEFTLGQGATRNIVVTVGRSNFDKPVTLAVEGTLPAGLTATFTVNPVNNGTTTTTLRVVAAGSANPGSTTITVHATGDGVAEQTFNVDVTVDITGSYTLGMLNSSLTVAQGGGGSATVLLTRVGGNGAGVALAVSGAPAGVTTTFSQSPTPDRGGGLTITASASVAPGTYPLTITGTSPGFANQNTALSLVVIAPASTTAMSVPFCADDMPQWFAYQNEGFDWQRVTATGTAFNFSATAKVAIAFAFVAGGESQVNIFFATRTELLGITDRDCDGTKTLTGTISGLTAGQTALVVMGSNGAQTTTANYTLSGVASRLLDLVATRGTVTGGGNLVPDKMIIRRSLDVTSTIPVLDFNAGEAFAPTASTLTITGFATGDLVQFQNNLWSATSTFGTVHTGEAAGGQSNLFEVPSANQVAGDNHELFVVSSTPSGSRATATVEYYGAPGNRTVALGPQLPTPTVTVLTSAPYARVRGQIASQTEYPTALRFDFAQGTTVGKFILMVGTAAYFGGRPATWDMVIPDLTAAPGFSTNWMMSAASNFAHSVQVFSAREDVLFGATPAQGESVKFGYRESTSASLLRDPGALDAHRRRSLLGSQYLRR